MPIDIAAVILDMDGLMLDTERHYKIAWQKAASELGYPLDDAFYYTLVGRTNEAGEAALAKQFGSAFPVARFRELWAGLWRTDVESQGISTKPGLEKLLDYLAAQAVPVAMATSSDQEYATFSLKAAKLDTQRFAQIITGDQVERGKPEPDIYLEAARRLSVIPARCMALEDSDTGILSASRAGMRAVQVPDLKSPSQEARGAAFRILNSLAEVPALMEECLRNSRIID